MNQTILLIGLCVGVEPQNGLSKQTRAYVMHNTRNYQSELRLLERYVANPTGFNPHFGKSDPASHVPRFTSHMTREAQLAAQKLGVEKDKELSAILHKPRMPIVLQMQVQYKGN